EDDAIVGGAGAFPFELSVPGGSLPCAGVTGVGVHPTHRRRGVLRAMMDTQLRDIHERGEPIAALFASEETIYGRFGYGIASWAGDLRVPHEWDAFAEPFEPAGATRFVTQEEARELFPPIYEAVRRQRPGMLSRSDAWWELRTVYLPESESAAPLRFVVVEVDGEPQAYGIYRTQFSFDGGSASSRLLVREAFCPSNEGCWRLNAAGPECERTDEQPDLALDVAALGSAYLGAVSFNQLQAALRLEELREGAIERADALFAWRPLPWCTEIF